MQRAVLKSAKNYEDQTLWEALYLDGHKTIENFFLDEKALIEAFSITSLLIKLPFHEKDLDNFGRFFPEFEDFSFLYNAITPLHVGQIVFVDTYIDQEFCIEPGWVTVKEIFSTPNTNLIWEKEIIFDDHQVWFTCKELPGVFCWNRLHKIQSELENQCVEPAIIKERKPD